MNFFRLLSIMTLVSACSVLGAQTTVSVNDVTQLRNAISTANGDSNSYIIELATSGTYMLSGAAGEDANASGDIDITKATGTLTIQPATGVTAAIDGGGVDRVFHLNNGPNAPVTINDITISGGNAIDDGTTTGEGRGGAFLKLGSGGLTLNNVTVTGNSASGADGTDGTAGAPATAGTPGTAGDNALGGGFYVVAGNVQLNNCTISSNTAVAGRGGHGGPGGPDSGGSAGPGGDGAQAGFAHGGAIHVAGGTVTVTGGTIEQNSATGGNGGDGGNGGSATMFAGSGGTPSFGGSARGGAIYVQTGTLTVTNATLDQNTTNGGNGGRGGNGGSGLNTADGLTGQQGGNAGSAQGAAVFGGGGNVTVTSSTLSNNTATGGNGGDGGTGGDAGGIPGNGGQGGIGGLAHAAGVFVQNATVEVINSTVSGNVTNGGSGGGGGNGGFGSSTANGGAGGNGGQSRGTGGYVRSSSLSIDNSTVANNTANDGVGGTGGAPGSSGSAGSAGTTSSGQAAGVFEDGTGGAVGAQSTIFADNTATIQPDLDGAAVTCNDCIIENGVTPGGTGNQTGDPALGALQNNGGATLTHAVGAGSIALNSGSNPRSLTTDQRGTGFPRDDGSGVDVGSYEFDPAATTPPPIVTDPASVLLIDAASYTIQGTAQTGALVRIYSDADNNGMINGPDAVVASMAVTGTTFSISVNLTQDADNNFTATADDGSTGESMPPVDVPTITEDSTAPNAPVVTDPNAPTNTTGTSYTIVGTAEAGALVRIYIDFDNSGTVNGADVVVATQQLASAVTAFSISTPITQSTTNNFVATAVDGAGNESAEADVPTITETTLPPISPPVITDPTAPVSLDAPSYIITGTAQADSLVRIYSDLNNDGFVNGGDTVVGSQQLTSGGTSFSIAVTLTQGTANDFLATAEDAGNNESLPVDVPTITDTNSSSGGGGDGGGGGCSVTGTPAHGLPWWLALFAGAVLVALLRGYSARRQ